MAELVALEETVDIEGPLGEQAEDVNSNGVAGARVHGAGLPLIDLEVAQESSSTLGKMRALFRATTGLEFFLFYQSSPTGAWKEYGFNGTIQMPHFCQLVQSTPEGLRRCTASHRDMMEKARRHPHLVCQRCHANLTSFHVPVSVMGSGLAYIQAACALDPQFRSEQFPAMYEKLAGLGLSEKEILDSVDGLTVVSTSAVERTVEWLELLSSYLVDISAHAPARREDVKPKPASFPLQEQVREQIGRYVALPVAQSNRSCGCSAALVERVAAFLDEYYNLPLSTQTIAWALGFEPSYFGKVFKKHRNISLTCYLKQIRLSRAKNLLEDPFLSAAEVAKRTGFSDASYFTRVFHGAFGITPSRFRDFTQDGP